VYLLHCKNFCGCHNVPPLSTIIKKKTGISNNLEPWYEKIGKEEYLGFIAQIMGQLEDFGPLGRTHLSTLPCLHHSRPIVTDAKAKSFNINLTML
jgi:hypothetical protein